MYFLLADIRLCLPHPCGPALSILSSLQDAKAQAFNLPGLYVWSPLLSPLSLPAPDRVLLAGLYGHKCLHSSEPVNECWKLEPCPGRDAGVHHLCSSVGTYLLALYGMVLHKSAVTHSAAHVTGRTSSSWLVEVLANLCRAMLLNMWPKLCS